MRGAYTSIYYLLHQNFIANHPIHNQIVTKKSKVFTKKVGKLFGN